MRLDRKFQCPTGLAETGLLVVVEDHWIEGGLGDAVLDAVAGAGELRGRVVKISVTEMPGSGTPEELRGWAGISAERMTTASAKTARDRVPTIAERRRLAH